MCWLLLLTLTCLQHFHLVLTKLFISSLDTELFSIEIQLTIHLTLNKTCDLVFPIYSFTSFKVVSSTPIAPQIYVFWSRLHESPTGLILASFIDLVI